MTFAYAYGACEYEAEYSIATGGKTMLDASPEIRLAAKVCVKVTRLPFDLTWPTVLHIPQELHQPPRMNDVYLWLNRLVERNVHSLELTEVNGSRIKLIMHVSDKGLRRQSIPVGAQYGSESRISDNAVLVIEHMSTSGIPKVRISFRAKKKPAAD